jgi:glycogen debranching enzyme
VSLARLDGDARSWMNAFTEHGPVTPRIGKPVEINALRVNALAVSGRLRRAGGANRLRRAGWLGWLRWAG